MTVTERDVIPCEDDREFLVECWKQCLAEMMVDVEEAKRRWKDASQTVSAESLAAVAGARAAFSDTLIKLEHAIDERLSGLRRLIDEKNGLRVHPYVNDKVHYEGELVTHEGSTYQARCDTGRTPPDEEHWICVAAAGLDGLSFRVRGTYRPGEPYSRLTLSPSTAGASSHAATIPAHVRVTIGRPSASRGKRDRRVRRVIAAIVALPVH